VSEPIAYLPGYSPAPPEPLGRYLPPIPAGVIASWLVEHVNPGEWVLDPFGTAPQLPVEAARAGYRVLVAANNPVARFLLELAACPLEEEALRGALADLAASRKGDERLEPHIRSLYATFCERCGSEVIAEAFLWEKDAPAPYARIYQCPQCRDAGERPATRSDQEKAARFGSGGPHRARALERIAPKDDPDRTHAEEALAAYLPRATYALFTLINKLESILATPHYPRRRELTALLLCALDQGNTLWPHPAARARPKQLVIPRRFRENNLWFALEEAVELLASPLPPVPLTTWPELPPAGGGVALYEGRLKGLGELFREAGRPTDSISGVVAPLPRPNQAFWTLSALWAGWLWGREAIGPFKSVLRRRRYDWAWHSTALQSALENLAALLPAGTPFFGLIGEAEPGFLSAALVAAVGAGFELQGLALREESGRAEPGQAQITWSHREGETSTRDSRKPAVTAREAALAYLRLRGEPAPFQAVHAAALVGLVERGVSPASGEAAQAEPYSQVQDTLEEALNFRGGFLRFGGSEKSLEVGQWWLRESRLVEAPLADRVEIATVRRLQKFPGSSLAEIDREVCAALPGLLTPGLDLVSACLESYGELEGSGEGRWSLRPADSPVARRSDLLAMRSTLQQLGQRLGFSTPGEQPLLWEEPDSQVAYAFFPIASAAFGELVFSNPHPAGSSIIVLPGARASLAVFKLRRDLRLRQAIESGWRFLKFRHVRQLAEYPSLARENLAEQLALDPLTESQEQMRLL
jgi:hypothetical protein